MWLKNEVLYPRFLRSILWVVLLHCIFLNCFLLFIKTLSLHPISSITEWLLSFLHWKTPIYISVLSMSIAAFGVLNIRFCTVEKHINSTRFEKICRSLSPYCLQHVFTTMSLGGLATYCYDSLFHNFQGEVSLIDSYMSSANDFEQSFIVGHGCFTGLLFSLKYFICNLYLIKFTLDQEPKVHSIKHQIPALIKDSFFCWIKAIHWYYVVFIVFGSPLKILTLSYFGNHASENESIIYSLLLNPKLLLNTMITGMMVSFVWSLYLVIFNAFVTEHHKFPIKVPIKEKKNMTLASALSCKDFSYLKYLAVLDLRMLAQYDPKRREQIFAISHPGGHPHEWKAISGICITYLQDFVYKLSEYTFAIAAASETKVPLKTPNIAFERIKGNFLHQEDVKSFSEKVLCYLREKPTVCYFFDELPNAKLMKLFASSQPYIWIIDAFGYLVSVSYTEDKFGVVQQTLPEIIRLLLDIKMAEEKMPVGLVGIRTYVRDPQGRYEHIHQRLSLKTTVNNALSRIAHTFREDINGIYLPEEYQMYLQRYLSQKKEC